MNLIDQTFSRLRASGQTALMPFITMGDPDLPTTIEIMKELQSAGADMLELGIPYSDPLADGPVIQASSQRALQHRIHLLDCLGTAKAAREAGVTIPLILFTYYNPVLQMGLERAFSLIEHNGFSGAIIPDLPIEEDKDAKRLAERHHIHLIPLVAPTSQARIQQIASQAKGFVYCVSSLGVTGVRSDFHAEIDEFLATVKRAAGEVPIAIGFGISTHEQVVRFAASCDGVIVGSAIVRIIGDAGPLLADPARRAEGLKQIGDFVRQLKG
jgi:tryptophan synthase alpha chain